NPSDYYGGLLADDPLATIVVTDPARDFLIQFLTDIGYKAADIDFEKVSSEQQCSKQFVLTSIAKVAETGITTGDAQLAVAAASTYLSAACSSFPFCWPSTWYGGASSWSRCVYGPGAFAASGCPPVTPL